jgi:hypothetical protein
MNQEIKVKASDSRAGPEPDCDGKKISFFLLPMISSSSVVLASPRKRALSMTEQRLKRKAKPCDIAEECETFLCHLWSFFSPFLSQNQLARDCLTGAL